IDQKMKERSEPICFWNFDTKHLSEGVPYIDKELQEGTTPMAKISEGVFTRNFRNYHHKQIKEEDYRGNRAILDNQYKLVVDQARENAVKELYNVVKDPGETTNLINIYPEI